MDIKLPTAPCICCYTTFARLAKSLLKDEESARDNHVFACNFDKYSSIKKNYSQTQQ